MGQSVYCNKLGYINVTGVQTFNIFTVFTVCAEFNRTIPSAVLLTFI